MSDGFGHWWLGPAPWRGQRWVRHGRWHAMTTVLLFCGQAVDHCIEFNTWPTCLQSSMAPDCLHAPSIQLKPNPPVPAGVSRRIRRAAGACCEERKACCSTSSRAIPPSPPSSSPSSSAASTARRSRRGSAAAAAPGWVWVWPSIPPAAPSSSGSKSVARRIPVFGCRGCGASSICQSKVGMVS